jgi:hypothetical protein
VAEVSRFIKWGVGIGSSFEYGDVRVTDAKEVGVGNPAEETFYHPNTPNIAKRSKGVKPLFCKSFGQAPGAP